MKPLPLHFLLPHDISPNPYSISRSPMSSPATADAVLAHYRNLATSLWTSGTYTPFIYPLHALGPTCFCAYLLFIPPIQPDSRLYKPVFYLRYPLFGFIVYIGLRTIRECRSASVTVAYGIGLISALVILWSAMMIIFGDVRGEFGRWERRDGRMKMEKGREELDPATEVDSGIGDALRRRGVKKTKTSFLLSNAKAKSEIATANSSHSGASPNQISEYIFQPLPSTFLHRLDWVVDIMTNLRGINWSHSAPHQPPRPPSTPPPSRSELLRSTTISLILHYFLIDVLKTLTLSDPYFLTLSAPPSSSPFPFPSTSRLFLSLAFTYTALQAIFLLSPLFACVLGPRVLGRHADPLLYPPYFHSVRLIATRGLAGFWGGTWHQIFRMPFESAGDFLARRLGAGWERRTRKGKFLRMITAFTLSGILHATGSYTTLPPTKPFSEAFLYFAIQPLGILAQLAIAELIRHQGWREEIPRWVREAVSAGYVLAWLWVTGPLIARDFGRNGIWLFEPVPVSFARGGRWCWGGQWVRWWGKGKWWERGLAF